MCTVPGMRVAIIGSREYPDLEQVRAYVRTLAPGVVVISGGAPGVDRTAAEAARARGLEVHEIRPDYARYGRHLAPKMRNAEIAEAADIMVAFHDGRSTGTLHAARCAEALGKRVVWFRRERRVWV